MSAVKRMPRYAVVPMNDVRRNMEGYRMWLEDVQSSPREELMSRSRVFKMILVEADGAICDTKSSNVPRLSRWCNSKVF